MADPIHSVVTYFNGFLGKYVSVCKCGWEGKLRDEERDSEREASAHYVPPKPTVVYG